MQLIAPLAAGIRGAESGTAEIYRRGTSTRATIYSDFEATATLPTSDVTLDSNGGATVYAGEYVRVLVRDSSGNAIREFTEGSTAETTDYIGPSFTGVNYTTANSAVSEPVSVQDVMDLWATSAGAPDFQVSYGGVATNLSTVATALSTLSTLVVSVKAFGATGDGVTNDVAAFTAAFAYLTSIGGGVLIIPPGTYLINAALAPPAAVSLFGAGGGSTAIVQSTAAAAVITVVATSVASTFTGLTLRHSSAAGAGVSLVDCPNGTKSRYTDCVFGSTSRFTQHGITLATAGTATEVNVDQCTFITSVTGIRDQRTTAPTTAMVVCGSKFQANTTGGWTGISSSYFVADACFFDNSTQSSGTTSGVDFLSLAASSAFGVVNSCTFANPAGGTANGINLPAILSATATFFEDQNTFGGSVSAIYGAMVVTFASKGAFIKLGSRESRVQNTTNNSSFSIDSDKYATVIVTRSSNANSTITVKMVPEGTRGRLLILNTSGGTIAAQTVAGPAGAGDFPVGGAGVAITAGQMKLWEYVGVHGATVAHVLAIADGVSCGTPA